MIVGEILREHGGFRCERRPQNVGRGRWAAKNAFKSLHWLATLLSSESSISTARYNFSALDQPATCVRSLFK